MTEPRLSLTTFSCAARYFKNTTSPMFTSMTGSQATLYNDSGTTFVLHTNAYPLMRVRATDEVNARAACGPPHPRLSS